jgi:predicted enzyme related to lactoylglutathione lyase
MTTTLAMITFDALEPEPLAQWWAERFGAEVGDTNGGFFVMVSGGRLPLTLGFQKVPDPTPGKNKVHLDLRAEDLDAEVSALVAAGATVVGPQEFDGFRWVTLADPDGNQFCVSG